jgi:hypothetical protein
MTDSKKRKAPPSERANTPEPKLDDQALAKDASELRALITRARRLIDQNDTRLAALDDAEEPSEHELDGDESAMEVPIFAPPVARRSEGSQEPAMDDTSDDQPHAIDTLPETFFTNTMGTLLLSQGRAYDACVVFERVLLRDPNNQEARRGLARAIAAQERNPTEKPAKSSSHTLLRDRGTPVVRPARVAAQVKQASQKEVKEPDGLLDRHEPPWGYDVDQLRVLPVDPTTLVVFWELRELTVAHAQSSVGLTGELALRIISIRRTPDGAISRNERLERHVGRVGDWFLHGVEPGATHQVSIGLVGRSGFLAILSAHPVSTARGAPAKTRAVVRARIELPTRTRVASAEVTRITEVVGPAPIVHALVQERATPALRAAVVISLPLRGANMQSEVVSTRTVEATTQHTIAAQSWVEMHAVSAVSSEGQRVDPHDDDAVEEFTGPAPTSGVPSSARLSSRMHP